MSPDTVSRAVKNYFERLRAMDEDGWVNTFAEDGVTHDPVGAPPAIGHQKIREFFQTVTGAFNEVSLSEDQVFVCGNGAAVKWTGRGISKQGRKVHFEGIDVFEIDESGKIKTVHAYWNPAEMVAQL